MLLAATPAFAQTAADSAAIRATALDYIEGHYEGNAERLVEITRGREARTAFHDFLLGPHNSKQ
jgi:hypothetical protein